MTQSKAFDTSHRIRACSYLLSLSLYQLLDPSDHAPSIDPRNTSKIGKHDIFRSGNDELNTALNTMTNNLSSTNNMRDVQAHAASFLLLIITMIYKIKAKVEQTTYNSKYCSIALRHGALNGLFVDFLDSTSLCEEFGQIKSAIYVTLADCFCEIFELCDKET